MAWIYLTQNTSSREILLDNIEEILDVKNSYFICKKQDEGWGLAYLEEDKFIWKIPPVYKDANSFSEGLFPSLKKDKWGYLDKEENEVLAPIWDYAYAFSEGRAIVAQEEKWGVINLQGNWVVSPSANCLRSYSDGVAVGFIKNTWFVINLLGKTLLTPCVDFMSGFYNGLSAFNQGGKILQSKVIMGGSWGFMDKKGKTAIPPIYSWVGNFTSDYAPYYQKEKDEWGLLSKKGEVIPITGVTGIREFSEGLALVEKNNLWGLISLSLEEVVPCIYKELKWFPSYGMIFALIED